MNRETRTGSKHKPVCLLLESNVIIKSYNTKDRIFKGNLVYHYFNPKGREKTLRHNRALENRRKRLRSEKSCAHTCIKSLPHVMQHTF